MKKVWIDITNVPHVNFLLPIINHFRKKVEFIFTVRDFAETKSLFENKISYEYRLIGDHRGKSKLFKVFGMINRTFELYKEIPVFDIKISVGGDASNYVAKIKNKKSITFDDNDKAPNWRYSKFTDYAFWPKAIPINKLIKQGFKNNKIYQYDGLKEHFYIADYKPSPQFKSKIPFDNYIVVRPENINANYVSSSLSITQKLVDKLISNGYNIIYLPRYKHDLGYVKKNDAIFIPDGPLSGLDLCYYSSAVLSGAGTLTREAACLGKPAISFYAGRELLTVDQYLINEDKLFHSRDVDEIVTKLDNVKSSEADLEKPKRVKIEIISKLEELIFNL